MRADNRILLEPQNPYDIRPIELASLAEQMQTLSEDCDVHIAYYRPPPGAQATYQVTFWEVLTIWIASQAGAALINQIVQMSVTWMKQRFTKESSNLQKRPKYIRIVRYEGDDKEVLEVIEITHPEEDPEYRIPSEREQETIARPIPSTEDEEYNG